MTRGKWIILGLLILLGGLVAFVVKEQKSTPSQAIVEAVVETPSAASTTSNSIEPIQTPMASSSPVEETSSEALSQSRSLQVIVQDEKQQGLAGAEISVKVRAGKGKSALTNFNQTITTDGNGTAMVPWPDAPVEQLELAVALNDYASRRMVWDFTSGDSVPANYTFTLKSGVYLSGTVVDPEGKPIDGAQIKLSRFWMGGEHRQPKGEEPAFSTQKQTTNKEGRWTARNLPAELLYRISVEASHPEFIAAYASLERENAEAQMRAGNHQFILSRGAAVAGKVVNEKKEPIVGATVWAGRRFTRERQASKTDEEGRFTFRNVKDGSVSFTAMAPGYAPGTKSFKVQDGTADEIVLRLEPGTVIQGVVQDESGEPIQGVRVAVSGRPGQDSYDAYEFSATTGSDGRFEWDSAPNEPMPFYFGKIGYLAKRDLRLKPNDENVVTLSANRQVQGQVVDAETGQPVKQFKVSVGRNMGNIGFHSDSGGKEFTSEEGRFKIEVTEEEDNAIQVTAAGYTEESESLPASKGGKVEVTVKLKPAGVLKGRVITLDGQPVAGAGVAIVEGRFGGKSIQFSNGRFTTYGSKQMLVTTDDKGQFEITSPPEEGTVVAASKEGFASGTIADVRASGMLTLQPLGRIEGVLISAKPGQQEIGLRTAETGLNLDHSQYKAVTDNDGKFVFENVPAGNLYLVRLVKTSARSWSHSHQTDVVVNHGETTRVTLGGRDATLQGSVTFEGEQPDQDYVLRGTFSSVAPKVPEGLSGEDVRKFIQSPEFQEASKKRKSYSVAIGEDGAIFLESVAPGQYNVRISAIEPERNIFDRDALATGETTIIVPEGASPGTPINIGEIVLKRSKKQ